MSLHSRVVFEYGSERPFSRYPPLMIFGYTLGLDMWDMTLHGLGIAARIIFEYLGEVPHPRMRVSIRPDDGLCIYYAPHSLPPAMLPLSKIVICRRHPVATPAGVVAHIPVDSLRISEVV